jgi:hypothetical protein
MDDMSKTFAPSATTSPHCSEASVASNAARSS